MFTMSLMMWGGDYFPERYILDFTDGVEYFNTLESAAAYVRNLTGKEV